MSEEAQSHAATARFDEPGALTAPASPDVFLSYAREDADFVHTLHRRLTAQGRTVWVDWESIPHSAEWWAEIEDGIESAAAFVAILSPASVGSHICARELAHAEASHARIIPIVRRDVEGEPVPRLLADRHWIFSRESDDADEAFAALLAALDTDLDEERLHARLRVRASEWQAAGRKRSSLLRGEDLTTAERWVAASAARLRPQEKQYVLASRRAVQQFQRRTTGAVTAALVVAIGLSIVAFVLRNQAVHQQHLAESRALAASSLLALSDDPELSLLLARQAARVQDTQQARQALRQALSSSHVRLTMRSPTGGGLGFARFTPDGHHVVTVDGDGPTHVFDARTGQQIRTLSLLRYQRSLIKAALSADGSRVLLLPNIGSAVALDVTGRTAPVSLTDPSDNWFSDAVLSPDGRLAVMTALHTSTARVFDTRTGAVLRTLPGNFGRLGLSNNGRVLALAGEGSVTTYDLTHFRRLATWSIPAPGYARLAFASDGSLFTVTSREVRRWNPVTGRPGAALQGRRTTADEFLDADMLAFSRDGRWVIGASGTVAGVWDARTGRRRTEIVGMGNTSFGAVGLTADGADAVTTSSDGMARVWDATSGVMLTELRGVPGGVRAVNFDASGRRVLTAGQDGTARIWDAGLGLPEARRPLPAELQLAVTRTLQGRWAARFFQGDRSVTVLDAQSGRQIFEVQLPRPGKELVFADHAAVMAVVYDHSPVELYTLGSQRSLGSLRGPGAVAERAVLSPDGHHLMTNHGDVMTVWDVRTLKATTQLRHHVAGQFPDTATAFSPDHRLLATVGTDGQVVLWRSSDGQVVSRQQSQPSPGFNASAPVKPAFSPDGKLFVAAGNWERQPSIWRTSDGRQVATMTESFNRVAFSPTAPLIVTDGLSVWDADSGRRLLQLRDPASGVSDAAFTPDGLRVISESIDGNDRAVFPCDVCGPLSRLLELADQRITRRFTTAEQNRYLR